MSRPSLAAVRREQLLDAVEACILEHGVDGVSFARVARIAGMQPSIVPHYFGSKAALMAAVVERLLARVEQVLEAAGAGAEEVERMDRFLDALFGGDLTLPVISVVVEQLRAGARFDESTRARLLDMYRQLDEEAAGALAEAYPSAPEADRRAVAYAILCLGVANNSLRGVGFDATFDRRARAAARILVDALDRATDRAQGRR